MTPELHRQLRALLADLYPTRADLTRVAYDAGIPLAAVALGSSALNDWDAVLHEAGKQQLIASLLDVVRPAISQSPRTGGNQRWCGGHAAGDAPRQPTGQQHPLAQLYAQLDGRTIYPA